jgi:hypothetical protein
LLIGWGDLARRPVWRAAVFSHSGQACEVVEECLRANRHLDDQGHRAGIDSEGEVEERTAAFLSLCEPDHLGNLFGTVAQGDVQLPDRWSFDVDGRGGQPTPPVVDPCRTRPDQACRRPGYAGVPRPSRLPSGSPGRSKSRVPSCLDPRWQDRQIGGRTTLASDHTAQRFFSSRRLLWFHAFSWGGSQVRTSSSVPSDANTGWGLHRPAPTGVAGDRCTPFVGDRPGPSPGRDARGRH